jgi:TP901 family phage tail tape measure protein
MALTIADIQILIAANIAGFQSGMNDAQSSLQNFRINALAVGAALTQYLTKPIIDMGKAAIQAGIEFEQSMVEIKAITGSTANEVDSFSETAKNMSKNTVFSSKEAAEGMLELLKAGVSTDKVATELKGTLDLAAAGNISLSDAAIVGSTSINAFKDDMLNTSKVADILAGAANASTTDVHGLRLGLSQASAVASGMGLSFEDTASALALFANNGLRGSDAGTSLKTMLLNLQPSTKKQKELFQELGLVTADGTSAFFDQTGKIKNLAGIASTLEGALAGMTDAQRLSALETLFGTDAIRAGNIIFKEGEKGVTALKDAIGNVTAEEIARTKTESLGAQLKMLKNDTDRVGISISGLASGPIKAIILDIRNLVNAFEGSSEGAKVFVTVLASLFAAIGPLVLIVIGLKVAMLTLTVVAGALGVTVGGLVAAFVLIPLAIAAVVTAGYLLIKNWDKISAVAGEIPGKIVQDWNDFKAGILDVWDKVKTGASRDWAEVSGTISTFLTTSDKSIATFGSNSKKNWDAWLVDLKSRTSNDWEFIQTSMTNALTSADTAISEKVKSWGTSFKDWLNKTSTDFATTMPKVKASVIDFLTVSDDEMLKWADSAGFAVGTVVKYFIDLPEKIGNSLRLVAEVAKNEVKYISTNITPGFTKALVEADNKIAQLPGIVENFVSNTADIAKNEAKYISTNITPSFTKTLQEADTWLSQLPGVVTNHVKVAAAAAENEGKWIFYNINNRIASVIHGAKEWLGKLPDVIAGFLRTAAATAENEGKWIFYNINNRIASVIHGAREWLGQLPGVVSSWVNQAASAASNTAGGIYNGIVNWIKLLPGKFTEIWEGIFRYVSGLYNSFYNTAANLGGAFWSGFKRAIGYKSPSYMEQAFMAMADRAKGTASDITSLVPAFVRAGKGISNAFTMPEMGMMGELAYGGTGMGSTGLVFQPLQWE